MHNEAYLLRNTPFLFQLISTHYSIFYSVFHCAGRYASRSMIIVSRVCRKAKNSPLGGSSDVNGIMLPNMGESPQRQTRTGRQLNDEKRKVDHSYK